MLKENGELVTTVTLQYTNHSDFDIKEILKEHNEEHNTNYKLEDIDDVYVKWNIIHLEMNDDTEIEYEGIMREPDYKRPDKYLYNQFKSNIN